MKDWVRVRVRVSVRAGVKVRVRAPRSVPGVVKTMMGVRPTLRPRSKSSEGAQRTALLVRSACSGV